MITTVDFIGRPSVFVGLVAAWLWATVLFANFAEAVAEGRGKAQADTLRRSRRETVGVPADRARHDRDGPVDRADGRRPLRGHREPGHPRRRRRHRGHRRRRRVGHHRRVGPGGPRIRRRPLGGDRRHGRAVGPDRRPDHLQARRDLPGPDDRAGRGREQAEDAERDRARHPHRRPDPDPARRRGHAAADGDLRQGHPVHRRARRAVRLPGADHDRRPAVGHRHRRDGPDGAAERAGDVRAGGGGGRATARPCCSTRPARSPTGTGWRPSSSRWPGSRWTSWPRRRCWPACPTRRRRAARSSTSPSGSTRSSRRGSTRASSSRSPRRPG